MENSLGSGDYMGVGSEGVKPTRWIKGPDFLWKDETTWPQCPSTMLSNQREDADQSATKVSFVSFSSSTATQIDEMFQRFSNWYKLRKFMAPITEKCGSAAPAQYVN